DRDLAEDAAAEAKLALEGLAGPIGSDASVEGEDVITLAARGEPFVATVHVGGEVGAGLAFPRMCRDGFGSGSAATRAVRGAGGPGIRIHASGASGIAVEFVVEIHDLLETR